MSNQPQCPIEEIELIPHPLETWRATLNALIAVAPGTAADIAWHLKDAREKTLVCHDRTAATQGEAKLIDRLMLLSAGRLVGAQLQVQTSSGSLNRRVTNRLTVVINGTDYDVSDRPGVMVGDMIRIDPNNMPPVVSDRQGLSPLVYGARSLRPQAHDHACSSAVAGQQDAPSAQAPLGAVALGPQPCGGFVPAGSDHPEPLDGSTVRPAPETPHQSPQPVLTAPQNPVRS